MYCPDCGLKNRDKAKFCGNCGRSLKDLPVIKSGAGAGVQESTPSDTILKSRAKPQPEQSATPVSSQQSTAPPSPPPTPIVAPEPTPVAYLAPDGISTDTPVLLTPSGNLRVGTILDRRYKIIQHIATGGMGAVYKGEDTRLNTIVAIKEMLDFFNTKEEREYAIKRFREEALLLADLRHPNIPRVTDHFIENNRYYLIMDFVEGKSPEKLLKENQGRGLPELRVVKWAIQICDVLHYLHTHNPPIIYRDMKPSNILICEGDKVMVIDFGIARHFTPQRPGTMIGTHGYAPPEQYKGNTEPRSDLYSLAGTLHHLLSGNDPTKGVPFSYLPIRQWRKDVSEDMERILIKCLQNRPEHRYANALELKKEFEKLEQKLLSASAQTAHPQYYNVPTAPRPSASPSVPAGYTAPSPTPTPQKGVAPPRGVSEDRHIALQVKARNCFMKGKELFEAGNLRDAKKELEKAVNLVPNYPEANTLLGYVLYKMGKIQESLPHLEKAVVLSPGSATAHLYLGKAYARLGKTLESQREYQIAGRLDPKALKSNGASFIERFLKQILS